MKCLQEDVALYGNFDTSEAHNLMVAFEKCDRQLRADCKSEEEIDLWLDSKFIIILENQRRFIPHVFGDERMEESARFRWFPITYQAKTDKV